MANKVLFKLATVVSDRTTKLCDVLVEDGHIAQIQESISSPGATEINAEGKYLIPGVIDDQVHFREPGLSHKANIATESKAAVAGGVTSFMEMPNTKPAALTQELLEDKYQIGKETAWANYSFFMGTSNDNLDEILKTDPNNVCGLKVFMGSSTGNMLVDSETVLGNIFQKAHMLVATHCEDEQTVINNTELAKLKYGENIPMSMHPEIRSIEACYLSSSKAIDLAKEFNTRLHILHISTAKELDLFENKTPLAEKKITAEVCVHHLWFDSDDYAQLGSQIKCNPAIKGAENRKALMKGLQTGYLDIVATDHAPHTWSEKQNLYLNSPSGLPLVQHSLSAMLEFVVRGELSMEDVVYYMCHAPAIMFQIEKRGYIKEGYAADLVLVEQNKWTVDKSNIQYKCQWSPFEGQQFSYKPSLTMVNGNIVYQNNQGKQEFNFVPGQRLKFNRY